MGNITENYSFEEFEASNKARQLGLDNSIPDETVRQNIKRLCTTILQPINDATGWKNTISSGYRSEAVNRAVGGARTSNHRRGCAADCNFYRKTNGKWVRVPNTEVVAKVKELKLPFSEMIAYNKQHFVHLAYTGVPKMKEVASDPTDGADAPSVPPASEVVDRYSIITVAGISDADENGNVPLDSVMKWLEGRYITVKDTSKFLQFTDGNTTNLEKIKSQYTPEELVAHKDDLNSGRVPFVKLGTKLLVQTNFVQAMITRLENSDIFMPPTNSTAYWDDNVKRLVQNDGYVAANVSGGGVLQQMPLNARVWVYLNSDNRLCDITSFVASIQTSKQLKNGSFTVELVPSENVHLRPEHAVEDRFMNGDAGGRDRWSRRAKFVDWFTANLQMNDMVFIRFERLQMEESVAGRFDDDIELAYSALTDSLVWDMIGFVDTVNVATNYESNSYAVTVAGRDFTKILQDDASYFIPQEFIFGSPNNFMISQPGKFLSRNDSGEIFEMNMFQTIKSMLSFIFGRLSTIEVFKNDSVLKSLTRSKFKDEVELGEFLGVWKLFKVFVDPALADRAIVDTSMVNPEGSMLDFVNKVCQEPFVEWFVDTWGSGVDMVVRKPPFDRASILDAAEKLKSAGGDTTGINVVIEPKDVLATNLTFDDRVYSWYRLVASNTVLAGVDEAISLTMLPIFYLDEYVKLFGNKRYQVTDNYIYFPCIIGQDGASDTVTMWNKLVSDFLFIIETTFYLPFSRKGTITVNGDRRIRVGSFIKFEPTNEMFYVTGVSNTVSFDGGLNRQTTITVERGLCIDNLIGTETDRQYFDILNLDEIKKRLEQAIDKGGGNGVQCNPSEFMNSNVMLWFLNRSHWRDRGFTFTGNLTELPEAR